MACGHQSSRRQLSHWQSRRGERLKIEKLFLGERYELVWANPKSFASSHLIKMEI
jgi:hypothetical protein